jgi:hypothetical protein
MSKERPARDLWTSWPDDMRNVAELTLRAARAQIEAIAITARGRAVSGFEPSWISSAHAIGRGCLGIHVTAL